MKKNRKRVIIVLSVVVVLAALAIVAYVATKSLLKDQYSYLYDIEIEDVDLTQIDDGVYLGEYQYGNNIYKAEVTVSDHRVIDISIDVTSSLKNYEYIESAKAITDSIIDLQSLEVDTIAGATRSSKAILLAIQDALK